MIGNPVSVCPNEPAQAKSISCRDAGHQLAELALQRPGLAREQRVALVLVDEVLVLAAADDAAIRRGAQIEIGIGGFPDHALLGPQPLRLLHGRDRVGRNDLVAARRHALWEPRSRSRTRDGGSGCVWPVAVSAVTLRAWHSISSMRPARRSRAPLPTAAASIAMRRLARIDRRDCRSPAARRTREMPKRVFNSLRDEQTVRQSDRAPRACSRASPSASSSLPAR